jgi:heat shock protein HslJ
MVHPSRRRFRTVKGFGLTLVAAAAALSSVSCTDGVTGPSDLMGGVWKLQSMRVAGATADFVPTDPDRFTVEFKADGFVGVVADCNSCGGAYSVKDEQLSVPEMACTLVLCATPNGGEFASIIDGTSTLDKDGEDTLEIESSEGRVTLTR